MHAHSQDSLAVERAVLYVWLRAFVDTADTYVLGGITKPLHIGLAVPVGSLVRQGE